MIKSKFSVLLLLLILISLPLSVLADMTAFEGNPETTVNATVIKGIVLVNKKNPLPKDYKSARASEASGALELMVSEAKSKKSYSISGFSGHRDYARQVELFNAYIKNEMDNNKLNKAEATKKAERYSARPGYSEHQTGLTFDIKDVNAPKDKNCEFSSCGNTEAMKWVKDNAHNYGFILRYTDENTSETGYDSEFWHFRFIGIEHAKTYKEKSFKSLESYLASIKGADDVIPGEGSGENGSGEAGSGETGSGESGEYVHKSPFGKYVIKIDNVGVKDKKQHDGKYLDISINKTVATILGYLNILCWILAIGSFCYVSLLWLVVLIARTRFEPAYLIVEKMTFNKIDPYEDFGKLITLTIFLMFFVAIVMSGLMPLIFALIYKFLSMFITMIFRL